MKTTSEQYATPQKLTKEQAIVISGYTGYLCLDDYQILIDDMEKRLNRHIYTDHFIRRKAREEIKELYAEDFKELCYTS